MPLWIRRLQPYLLLTLFALPAVWPFTHPGLPRTNDNLPHLYRVVELDRLVQAGVLFPRWAPDLVHGYGYPVFNFFPYLSHYVAEVYHLLGFSFLTAFKAAYVTALLCAAWFAYRLGREYFGETAGLIAGVAYLYSPYLLYNAHIRGALPEITALAILPLTMLYLHRAAWGDRRSVAWAGMALAAFVFAHNAVGLQIMPLLLVYTLFETVTRSALFTVGSDGRLEMGRWKLKFGIWDFLFAIIPFLLGGLLSAFYWLPSLTEIKYVQFSNATANSSMWYFTHFTPLRELLALPRLPVDPDLLNPPVVHSLPLAALVFATVSLLRLPFSPTPKLPGLFFAALALLTTFLVLPASRPVWDALPLLRLTLYPWRLLGLVTLLLAVLAGSLFAGYPTTNHGRPGIGIWDFILSLMLLALMIAGLPLASPPLEPAPTDPTLANVAEFEIPPDLIGTSTAAEFLPAWVKKLPDLAPIRERLVRSERVERFEQPPAGTHIKLAAEGARGHTFSVAAAQPFTFVYRTFYFPGWRATLDGAAAPVRITDPEGLMAVDLPAGEHILTFHFGGTPPRVMGTVLSLIGLAACAALLVISNWRLEIASSALPRVPASPLPRALALFILAIALAAARPLLYDAGYTPLLRRGLTPDGLAGVTHPLDHDFVGELTLLGWDAEREAIGADDPVTINLYFKANHKLGVAYGFQVKLVDENGLTWSEADTPRPRDWRFTPGTDFWPDDQYIVESYLLTPLAGTPPGEYFVEVNVFAYYNLQSIGATRLGPITINAPSRKRNCEYTGVEGTFAQQLSLQSAKFNPAQAAPGGEVTAALCWRAGRTPRFDWLGQLQLLDSQGLAVVAHSFQIGSNYPTSYWTVQDVVRDQITVRLPAAVETGDYQWQLVVESETLYIGSLHVTAPERVFIAPPVERALEANLGPVTLVGVSLPRAVVSPGQPVSVDLVWKSNQAMADSYHVFVHLLNDDGALAAQSDGAPADWTRLTTGWLPGEFVSETRALNLPADLPPGTYPLFAGMYLPATGDRLTTEAFPDGRVPLGAVAVGP